MGSNTCCFLQSPFPHSFIITSTLPPSFFYISKTSSTKTNARKTRLDSVCSLKEISSKDSNFSDNECSRRRGVLVLGISAISFIQQQQCKASAEVGTLVQDGRDKATSGEQSAKLQPEASSNPILSFLNTVGIIGSGVLGALYTLARKEKIITEATIESLKIKLVEKESSLATLTKNFEKSLDKEKEERLKETKKAKDAQLSLSSQLMSANRTILGLQKELQDEKKLVEEYKGQINLLQIELAKSRDEKISIEAEIKQKDHSIEVLQERISLITLEIQDKDQTLKYLNASLSDKAAELSGLTSLQKNTELTLAEANSEVRALKDKVAQTQKDLDLKISSIADLNKRLNSLASERDDISKKVESLQEDYNNFKLSSEKKAVADADVLEKREHEIQQLEEKLGSTLSTTKKNEELIAGLTQERDDLIKMLEIEAKNVKNVTHELRITEESLGTSKVELSDLSEQLKHSIKVSEDLASEIVQIQTEFGKARESLKKSIEKEKSTSNALSDDLVSVKDLLVRTKEELQTVSTELIEATESRESLKKELLEVYKKAEVTNHDLKEEKKIVASMRKELGASEKLILKDRESRECLERDLEDATKSLDELNVSILILSRELDLSKSRIESLETEKHILYKTLEEQKEVSREARENVEDAHDLILKLGKEREVLDKKVMKLEEEMALAKGEILRLRSQLNSSKSAVNSVKSKKSSDVEGNTTPVPVKKTRRRKPPAPSDDST